MAEQNYHWETSKENVLPLKQGRTVAAIEETFQQNSSKKGKINNEKTEREKRYFYARSVVYSSRVSLSFAFILGKKTTPKEQLILKNTDLFSIIRNRTKL